jgi:hypothetical protein
LASYREDTAVAQFAFIIDVDKYVVYCQVDANAEKKCDTKHRVLPSTLTWYVGTSRRLMYLTHVSSGGNGRNKSFVRVSQIHIRITGDPVCAKLKTGHSTIGTSGLIVVPLRVPETQIEVKIMFRHKRSPIEVMIYRLENYHQVGSGALYKLSRQHSGIFF